MRARPGSATRLTDMGRRPAARKMWLCRGGRAADWPAAVAEGCPFGTGIGIGRYLGDDWGTADEDWEAWSPAAQQVWAYASGLAASPVQWEVFQREVWLAEEEE